jgi:crotonobetainyl-CoA:carnitine CoA-transferase CaiB-like acyl-CoA transferase
MLGNILAGLRVIDLTQNVAGPFCTQILGDMGAEVIKIERPGSGDDIRLWMPPAIGGESSTFLALNRNKKSVCVDVSTAEGSALVQKLASTADVFVHSMRPGSAESRGLGYDDLSALNPKLVYCAISAFGEMGPLAALPGYDPLMQAFTGIMSVTGNEGEPPVRVSVSLIDLGTGMWSALGAVAGLFDRMKTGRGTKVHASLLETGLSWMTVFIASFGATGSLPRKLGSAMSMTAPYEAFRSADGHVFIAAGNDRLFKRVCEALGCPALAEDKRFLTNTDRVNGRKILHDELEALTATIPTAAIVEALREVGAPCSELNSIAQALDHEQVKAMDIIADLPVRAATTHRVVRTPLTMNGARSDRHEPPPALGANTDEILQSLGLAEAEIAALRGKSVVA